MPIVNSHACETSWRVSGTHEGGPRVVEPPGDQKETSSLGRKLWDQSSLEVSLAVNKNKILCRGTLRASGSCLKVPRTFPVDST